MKHTEECSCVRCRQDDIRERMEKVQIKSAMIISARTEGEQRGRRETWDAMRKDCKHHVVGSVLHRLGACSRHRYVRCTYETCPLLKAVT